jgi:GDP-4-dehydro-6-deoxy-D-mannose reductase
MTLFVSRTGTDAWRCESAVLRFLVTGVSGFAGRHLSSHLTRCGHEVLSLARPGSGDTRVDVRDAKAVIESVERAAPEGVFHLAALAFIPHADSRASQARDVNVAGTANVLDAAREAGVRTVVVSSGAVYGHVSSADLPVVESASLAPVGVYAETKAAAEAECERRGGLQDIVRVRPFNHTGPGQSSDYVCSAFARQIAEVERGLREPVLSHGDLTPERDFCDVRDVVKAYLDAFERGQAGEVYNVCSGRPVSIGSILETLSEMSRVPVRTAVGEERLLKAELDRAYGSAAKLREAVGWSPLIPLRTTLADLLDDWRQRVSRSNAPGDRTSK